MASLTTQVVGLVRSDRVVSRQHPLSTQKGHQVSQLMVVLVDVGHEDILFLFCHCSALFDYLHTTIIPRHDGPERRCVRWTRNFGQVAKWESSS